MFAVWHRDPLHSRTVAHRDLKG